MHFSDLDKETRARLRTLSKDNAEDVGRHLVMAGLLIEEEPEVAYKHAQVALARGGRVDVVREAAAIAAYATGRYAEALREFRTVRRLSGDNEHLPLMVDCERGLGRPERAIALSKEPEAATLSRDAKAELGIVVAGARMDLGDMDAAIATLLAIEAPSLSVLARVSEALSDIYRAAGRDAEADAVDAATAERAKGQPHDGQDEPAIVVFDTATENVDEPPELTPSNDAPVEGPSSEEESAS